MSYRGDVEEKLRAEWGKVVADAREEVRFLKDKLTKQEQYIVELERQAQTGRDFETMMDAVKANPIIKSAWEKFMVTLRMTGND